MMNLKLDVVVLGNEPAGRWLGNQLNDFGMSIGWLETGPALSRNSYRTRICIDASTARDFRIEPQKSFELEFVTPTRIFSWSQETLSKQFPGVALFGSRKISETKLLQMHPELLGFCQAIWARFGRSKGLSPESLIGLVKSHEFSWWVPRPAPGVHCSVINSAHEISIDTLDRCEIQIRFGTSTWDTQHLVVALSHEELHEFNDIHPFFGKWLTLPKADYPHSGVIVWDLFIQRHFVPANLGPICVVLDSEVIPDSSEILVFDAQDNPEGNPDTTVLSVYIPTPWPTTAKETHAKALAALETLEKRMPLIRQGLKHSVPVLEGSVAPSTDALKQRFIPDFSACRVHSYHTRHKQISWIAPDHHVHFIYPRGPLTTAHMLLESLTKKGQRIVTSKGSQTGATGSSSTQIHCKIAKK